MKISYDVEVDALSITFSDTTTTTQHVAEGIAIDYDPTGKIAGIEILDATKRFGAKENLNPIKLLRLLTQLTTIKLSN